MSKPLIVLRATIERFGARPEIIEIDVEATEVMPKAVKAAKLDEAWVKLRDAVEGEFR